MSSRIQGEDGFFEVDFEAVAGASGLCHSVDGNQTSDEEYDVVTIETSNPCTINMCEVIAFAELTNHHTSKGDKERQDDVNSEGVRGSNSKRFHSRPPYQLDYADGTDQLVFLGQKRKFVFASKTSGSDSYSALIAKPKRSVFATDVLTRAEKQHCPASPCPPPLDDDGATNVRAVAHQQNPKAPVRNEIFYPWLEHEQDLSIKTPPPPGYPFGPYADTLPNWKLINPGTTPLIDYREICGPVPCPRKIDRCKPQIPCRGCNEFDFYYVNHWGALDLLLGPAGRCPTPKEEAKAEQKGFQRVKGAINLFRLYAAGPEENEPQSTGFTPEQDGTVFPDVVGQLPDAGPLRIKILSGGEVCDRQVISDPMSPFHAVRSATTRKGVIENNTHKFHFQDDIDPEIGIVNKTCVWTITQFDCETGDKLAEFIETDCDLEYTFPAPGRYDVKLEVSGQDAEGNALDLGKAEVHSFNIIEKECDPECVINTYLPEAERQGVPVRIIARGEPGAIVNVKLSLPRRDDMYGPDPDNPGGPQIQKGMGAVSLDGYVENEHENGFTEATMAKNVERRAQYFSMEIDGNAHFPFKNGDGGIDTESLGDAGMVTWVVFLQGIDVNNIADNLELVVNGREVRASCEINSETGKEELVCECVYTPTNWEPFNVVRLVLYKGKIDPLTGRGAIGAKELILEELEHLSPVQSSNANPDVIVESLSGSSIHRDGDVLFATISVSGYSTFPLADIVPDGSANLLNAKIKIGANAPIQVALTREQEAPSLLRPYAAKYRFAWSGMVPVMQVDNSVVVSVVDPITNQEGQTQHSFRILPDNNQTVRGESPIPPLIPGIYDLGLKQPLSISVDFSGFDNLQEAANAGSNAIPVHAGRYFEGQPINDLFTVTAALTLSPDVIQDALNRVKITLTDAQNIGLSSTVKGYFSATVQVPELYPDTDVVTAYFEETSASSSEFVIVLVNAEITTTGPLQQGVADQVTAKVRTVKGSISSNWEEATLIETGADTKIFANNDSSFAITITNVRDSGNQFIREWSFTVSNSALGITNAPADLYEELPGNNLLTSQAVTSTTTYSIPLTGNYGNAWINGPWSLVGTEEGSINPPRNFSPVMARFVGLKEFLLSPDFRFGIFGQEHELVELEDWVVSAGDNDIPGVFTWTGRLGIEKGEVLGAGHVSKDDGFVFVVMKNSFASVSLTKFGVQVLDIAKALFEKLEAIAKDRFKKRTQSGGSNRGDTYGPNYATDGADDPFPKVAEFMYETYKKGSGSFEKDSMKAMGEHTSPPKDHGEPAGIPNGATTFYWDATVRLEKFEGFASKYLIGYYKDVKGFNQTSDFSSQSQNTTDFLHFNTGIGWKMRELNQNFEALFEIFTSNNTDQWKKARVIDWLLNSDYYSLVEKSRVKRMLKRIGGKFLDDAKKAKTFDEQITKRRVDENGRVIDIAGRFKEAIDIMLLSKAFGGASPNIADIFLAYDLASFEGFEFFGQDSFNDVIATVAGFHFAHLVVSSQQAGNTISSVSGVENALNFAFSLARLDFQSTAIISNSDRFRESFFSLMMVGGREPETNNFKFSPVVMTEWEDHPDIGLEKATLWKSTIGIFLKKNYKNRKDILRDPRNHEDFLTRVEEHLRNSENTDWEKIIPNGEDQKIIKSDKIDVKALHQMIETLSIQERESDE